MSNKNKNNKSKKNIKNKNIKGGNITDDTFYDFIFFSMIIVFMIIIMYRIHWYYNSYKNIKYKYIHDFNHNHNIISNVCDVDNSLLIKMENGDEKHPYDIDDNLLILAKIKHIKDTSIPIIIYDNYNNLLPIPTVSDIDTEKINFNNVMELTKFCEDNNLCTIVEDKKEIKTENTIQDNN